VADDFIFRTVAASGGGSDIIFVHGLSGDPVATWTCPGSGELDGDYWPKWIYKDVQGLNVYTLGYPASLFAKWVKREMSLYERAKATLEYLASYEIGPRPIALIAHSLGGLLAKQMIRTGLEASDPSWKAIATNCRLVMFLATPHTGSSLASIFDTILPSLSSSHAVLLQSGNSQLDELNEAYRRFAPNSAIQTAAYYETQVTKAVIVVDKTAADPGVANTVPIPVEASVIALRDSLILLMRP
jgi:hypothetical protein